MSESFVVLLPPLLVLLAALLTRQVVASLLLGIIASAVILTGGSPLETIKIVFSRFWTEFSDTDHLFTFGFLISLGILIELLTRSGGISAYSRKVKRYINGQRSTQTLSLCISTSFFLDDYLNSLTTGAIMRPLTDSAKIPRAKLAFLLACMSAPLCVLVPATSWIAMILIQLQVSGISNSLSDKPLILADPFGLYLQTIPFLLYPLCIILSAWFIVRQSISFGTMRTYEIIAQKTGNLFGGKKPLHDHPIDIEEREGSIYNFILPLSWFMITLCLMLLFTGDFYFFNGHESFMYAILHAHIFSSLCIAGLSALIFSFISYAYQRLLSYTDAQHAIYDGIMLMKNSFIVLLLAWTLSSLLKNDLHTGQYLAHILIGSVSVAFIPVLFFITSIMISASTGSAWGTIAVMVPLGIPFIATLYSTEMHLALESLPLLLPTLGALLAGAVAGGHFSAITDSSVMASTSAGCYHIDHVQTQISYSMPALIGSTLGYLLAGILLLYNWSSCSILLISLISSLSVTVSLLAIRARLAQ